MQDIARSIRVRWAAAVMLAAITPLSAAIVQADNASAGEATPSTQAAASLDDLKSQALADLQAGQFTKGNDLLARATSLSADPNLARMAGWSSAFEAERQRFAAERHDEFEKAVADVRTLLDHADTQYAIDAASRAYLLADDKDAFVQQPWVQELINNTIALAHTGEQSAQWVKAQRLYSDLGSMQPSIAEWKEDLKATARRLTLLALYTPDRYKQMLQADGRDRDAADAILRAAHAAATQPAGQLSDAATQPATTEPAADAADTFKLDWHDTLRGIDMGMLVDALDDAVKNYYRDVDYRKVAIGGLTGLRAVLTTQGLESAFPNLADAKKKAVLLTAVDGDIVAWQTRAAHNADDDARDLLDRQLTDLQEANGKTVGLPKEVLVSEFADGAFGVLDPFSSMIWPSEVAEFNKSTQGEFTGVGVQIEQDPATADLRVASPLEDTPAYRAGIAAGDIIVQINGKPARGISLTQAVNTITGPAGSLVRLTIRHPDGGKREYLIRREMIHVASLKGWQHLPGGGWNYFVDADNKIAYLRITNFTRTTGDELNAAISELNRQGVRGIILDLRYNPGGLLTAAADVSDKFLSGGTIVSTHPDRQTPNLETRITAHPADDDFDKPLVVLVNQYSASASEIVSGALHDQHRATLVGERTFGKGSVQMLFPLADREAYLKLTTSHYYLPSGRCIHREENSTTWGVDPDVTIAMTPEQMKAAIDAREQLDVLRDANSPPAQGEQEKLNDVIPEVGKAAGDKGQVAGAVDRAATQPATAGTVKKDLLSSDPQMAAALLLLRVQLTSGPAAVAVR